MNDVLWDVESLLGIVPHMLLGNDLGSVVPIRTVVLVQGNNLGDNICPSSWKEYDGIYE
jgi:hypothetical protein